MNRRDFMKVSVLSSVALLIPFGSLIKTAASLPVETMAHGIIYRGTGDGKIFISNDSGRTWKLHTNFGPELSIIRLSTDFREQVRADLGYKGHSFKLTLNTNGNRWKTV